MSLSAEAIDRIVANVLNQISPTAIPAQASPPKSSVSVSVSLSDAVITAEAIESVAEGSVITVGSRAIVTPAAWDAVKSRRVQLHRGTLAGKTASTVTTDHKQVQKPATQPLLIVVRSSKVVDQIWEDLSGSWKRELLGCPDDAAQLAISSLCRGDASQVVILTEQTHRTACLSNRNQKVKAVAIQETGEIKTIRKQLRANVWCLDPSGRAYFELKNLIRQIQSEPAK